ncbi:unnamed protein product [Blepharisma stoltei]|uniref:Calcium-transporting ATPase n=1 Tax=Blepharisma stoltei TaxID=1481888 RepID=A0AAU9IVR4_9CILI|nr:unnamed protein product [Blepharisma stoltei]
MSNSHDNYFSIAPESLSNLFEPDGIRNGKSFELLSQLNGVSGICELLKSNASKGISENPSELTKRAQHFGDNRPHIYNRKPFWRFLLMPLSDTVLQILVIASIVSLIVGTIEDPIEGWYEGLAILVTVCIVIFVTAINDYKKESQFIKLNLQTDLCNIIVIREGMEKEITLKELLVGDLLCVTTGDILQGDGIYIRGSGLSVDESSITGESKLVKKEAFQDGDIAYDSFLISGAKIIEGSGLVLVCAVGQHSVLGRNRRMMNTLADEPETPLQERLTVLATFLGKIGFYAGIILSIALLLHLFIGAWIDERWGNQEWTDLVDAIILGITIMVVAIPEGLPLALTLAMAYSILRMKDEQIFVRHLKGCEIMGAATNILSDKTGTLTQNIMTVTKAMIFGESLDKIDCSKFPSDDVNLLVECISRNSTAFINNKNQKHDLVGNRTECALLMMLTQWGFDYHAFRNPEHLIAQFAFNPRTKRMTTVYDSENGEAIVYSKGAGEVILDFCDQELLCNGLAEKLTDERKKILLDIIKNWADLGLRVITVAYKKTSLEEIITEGPERKINEEKGEQGLILIGMLGIEDPLRPEAKQSVEKCKVAGVIVRMVTGDNSETAKRIAKNCAILPPGILDEEIDDYIMEGAVFREKVGGLVTVTNEDGKLEGFKVGNLEGFKNIIIRLRVIARCSPEDKLLLVIGLRALGEVVGVTGDGSNDAPALKHSDIGLAMMSGTPLAKESADIILLDDNFESVVNSVKWGRNVYASIRKFLTFQMTCNAVALAISIIGAGTTSDSPLNAIQMLWVNLIMDALAALALATEPPTDQLFFTKPFGRKEKMIIKDMVVSMITQSAYQIGILLVMLYEGPCIFDIEEGWGHDSWDEENGKHFTLIFHTFVMMQIFNEICCRKLSLSEINIFKGFFNNSIFISILVVTTGVQLLLVNFGGSFVRCTALSLEHHLICVGLGAGCILVSLFVRCIYKLSGKSKKSVEDEKYPLLRSNSSNHSDL